MSKHYHISRPRGNLLPRALPPVPEKPMEIYKIDIEHYNQTGEVRRLGEMVAPYPDGMKNRIFEMIRQEKTCGEIHRMCVEEFPERPVSYNTLSVSLAKWRKEIKAAEENTQNEQGVEDMKIENIQENVDATNDINVESKDFEENILPACYGEHGSIESICPSCVNRANCLKDTKVEKPDCFGNHPGDCVCAYSVECCNELYAQTQNKLKSEQTIPELKLIPTSWDGMKTMNQSIRQDYHDEAEAKFREDIKHLFTEVGL